MATIVLAGGGTGGHVYPALAIGDVLRARGHTVLYYGDPDRWEGRAAPARGYDFRTVRALQYPRGGIVGKARFAVGLLRSTWATIAQLRGDHVDAVLGVGGYISAPAVLAAWWLGRPTAIHEANVVPGLANQLCARVAKQVLITFPQTADRLPGRAPRTLVGIPVNPKILGGDHAEGAARYGLDPARPIVLVVGGSLGAARINELAIALARDPERTCQIVHITGPKYIAEVRAAYGDVPAGVHLRDYEDQMGLAYAAADLVVCRAGSATVAELGAVGRASVLIPSPNVTENHQEGNARGLEAVGGARVIVEAGWDTPAAVAVVRALVADGDALARMAAAAKTTARLDAAERAADVVVSLLG